MVKSLNCIVSMYYIWLEFKLVFRLMVWEKKLNWIEIRPKTANYIEYWVLFINKLIKRCLYCSIRVEAQYRGMLLLWNCTIFTPMIYQNWLRWTLNTEDIDIPSIVNVILDEEKQVNSELNICERVHLRTYYERLLLHSDHRIMKALCIFFSMQFDHDSIRQYK